MGNQSKSLLKGIAGRMLRDFLKLGSVWAIVFGIVMLDLMGIVDIGLMKMLGARDEIPPSSPTIEQVVPSVEIPPDEATPEDEAQATIEEAVKEFIEAEEKKPVEDVPRLLPQ